MLAEKELFIEDAETEPMNLIFRASQTICDVKKTIELKQSIRIKDLFVSSIVYKRPCQLVLGEEIDENETLAHYTGYQIEKIIFKKATFNINLVITTKKGLFKTGRRDDSSNVKVRAATTVQEMIEKVSQIKEIPMTKIVASSIVYSNSHLNIFGKQIDTSKTFGDYHGNEIETITIEEK